MSDIQRIMYDVNKLKNDGIIAIDIMKRNNISNIDKQAVVQILKKFERFLYDKQLSNFIARENRRLYNDIIDIYNELKKRINARQEISQYENDRLNQQINAINEVYKIVSQLFQADTTNVENITKRLNQVSFVLNNQNVNLNYVDKDLYYRYQEARKKLLDITNIYHSYLDYIQYVKESYVKYKEIEDKEEKQTIIRHIANKYRFLNNHLKSFNVKSNINTLEEIKFFLEEYKMIMKEHNKMVDETNLNDFGVPEDDDTMGNADGISRLI